MVRMTRQLTPFGCGATWGMARGAQVFTPEVLRPEFGPSARARTRVRGLDLVWYLGTWRNTFLCQCPVTSFREQTMRTVTVF